MFKRTKSRDVAAMVAWAAVLLSLQGRAVFSQGVRNPFQRKAPAPEFPPAMQWLNTSEPLTLAELRGKFVLLDFWTYCCINCMHVLPELKQLEEQYAEQLVVIGVHSAKFTTERDSQNISDAILRYEIAHPVVNDDQHLIWKRYGVRSWPTTVLIDPGGNIVYARSGEFEAQHYATILDLAIPYYRQQGQLTESKIEFDLLAEQQADTPLRFPGKVLADEASNRLYISDSNHNRIVVTDLQGTLQTIVGTGAAGARDGELDVASFHHPQGLAMRDGKLYVADTENHLIREIDFSGKRVLRVAGTGKKARVAFPGYDPRAQKPSPPPWLGTPRRTAIASPWDLWWHAEELYIAMAGPHQIWRWSPARNKLGPYAGNGREDIIDGPRLPNAPYAEGSSSFAQPSGLASDGKWLFVADSEGSSIRAVPLGAGPVRTVVGTAELPQARLFTYGDRVGNFAQTRLQHALGLSYHDSRLFVADTYNNKIKVIDLEQKVVRDLAGDGEPGDQDQPARFDEPSGLSATSDKLFVADTNNHVIRVIDLTTQETSTLHIEGLVPPIGR